MAQPDTDQHQGRITVRETAYYTSAAAVYILAQVGQNIHSRKMEDVPFQNARECQDFGLRYHRDLPAEETRMLGITYPVGYWKTPLFGEEITLPADFSIQPCFDLALDNLNMKHVHPDFQKNRRRIIVVFYRCEEPLGDIPAYYYCGVYHISWYNGAFYTVENPTLMSFILDELKLLDYPIFPSTRNPLFNGKVYEIVYPDIHAWLPPSA